jgi:amidase
MDDNLAFAPAITLAALVRDRKIGSLELLDMYLARIERLNPALNAVVALRADEARACARRRDDAVARGNEDLGPLHGVPMTIKESFDLPGLPTTWGIPDFADNLPERPALAARRLDAAGAVIFGKTNVPVGLADWQTFNPIYGVTNNPWDMRRGPGGSSGGSAAALAAGLTGLELGSDIGGSIRNPAHYCGVYGHKPSFEIVPREGQALPETYSHGDLAVIGPLARSAADLELALQVLAGPDETDARAWSLHLPPPPEKPISAYRIGVMPTAACAEVDATVQREILALADWLEKRGAQVDREVEPVDSALAHEAYIMLLRAATSSRIPAADRGRLIAAEAALGDRADYFAWQLRGNVISHWEWLRWDNIRHRLIGEWSRFFDEYDLLLCPAAATPAFPHNHTGERWERMISVNGADQPSTTQMFWAGYSGMAFLPSTVAPIGLSPEGMPVGVQIVGPRYADLACIRFARHLEAEYHSFTPPPRLEEAEAAGPRKQADPV